MGAAPGPLAHQDAFPLAYQDAFTSALPRYLEDVDGPTKNFPESEFLITIEIRRLCEVPPPPALGCPCSLPPKGSESVRNSQFAIINVCLTTSSHRSHHFCLSRVPVGNGAVGAVRESRSPAF
ncbi:hypothetical protein E2P81_ATG03037 [Venturia nashicola]|uniref:Uncharacterized protein n=1 Tax=Venturia nashicola TaxID=86259 RepID=A0A4Z1P5S9_9PEZI|nr:hypothetical protein E6O75_ATG03101 [Venturia nashicola]TLD36148.1 hypothetical protein E2P81_ATG03037 [Venturia nashicola]